MHNLIIYDTDAGIDDTLSIIWLSKFINTGNAKLLAITTCPGNVDQNQAWTNMSRLCKFLQLDVPIGRSSSTNNPSDGFHGSDGMGGESSSLPLIDINDPPISHELIISLLNKYPHQVTVVCSGPLTNLAMVPNLELAREVVSMSGVFFEKGNITSSAEFNAWGDPRAYQQVLDKVNLTILPLNVTHHITILPLDLPPSPLTDFIDRITKQVITNTLEWRDAIYPHFFLHDGSTILYLFYPEMFQFQRGRVEIETNSESIYRGKMFIDLRHRPKPNHNAWIAMNIDTKNSIQLFKMDMYDVIKQYLTKTSINI
jgi:purine nucleosidase